MSLRLRAAVVGCGTAGPAAALNLARRLNWSVDVFDKAPVPQAVGAGIGVQPIGLTALKKLGLLHQALEHGARIEGIRTWVHDSPEEGMWAGRRVLDIEYKRLHPALFGMGLHRGVLFEALLEACAAHDPGRGGSIATKFGVEVVELEQGPLDVVTLRDSESRRHGEYDLVVIADGARSRLRDSLGLITWRRTYKYGALHALVPDEKHIFGTTLQQVHTGPGCHTTLGFLPTGLPWTGAIDTVGDGEGDTSAASVATLYYNLHVDELPDWKSGGLQKWKDECSRLMPHAAEVIQDGLQRPEQVQFAQYHDGGMMKYHKGRVVVLGDASHAMSPQLGQGANLALIDAEKLVDCLVRETIKGGGSKALRDGRLLTAALDAYTKERWWRLNFYAMQSRLLTPFFSSKSVLPLQTLRNALFYPAAHTPVLRAFMHKVLCGAQSPDLLRLWRTIPEQEYMGFLEGLPPVGAALPSCVLAPFPK